MYRAAVFRHFRCFSRDFIIGRYVHRCRHGELLEVKNIEPEFKKGIIWDLVTIYDKKVEAILNYRIKEKYPTHKFIGEEEAHSSERILKLTDDPTWIIDPIDGTANFIYQLPLTAISVGLTINKEQVMGIVYNPYMNELYTAIKGQGAYLNGNRIRTTGLKDIKRSIFNYEISVARRNDYYFNLYMYRLKHLMPVITGVRSLGTAVLGLCYVACGRLDAYQCDGLYPWDAAAGVLIVREAGGYVADTSGTGKDFDLMDPNFLATSSIELSEQFLELEKVADEEMSNALRSKKEFSL